MGLRHAIAITMVVPLVGCSFTSDPEPTRAPSATTSDNATSEPGITSSPTVIFPVPMSVTQDLIKGDTKQIVRRMMEIMNNRPALKLDVSASEVTLTTLETNQKPFTLRWRANQIAPAESDIQYLGQTAFRPTDYPLGDISKLFNIATRMGAIGTKEVLQVVEQHFDEVYLIVATTPETKTVFFGENGTAMRNLGHTSAADLADGLAAVIAGSRVATQIGFGPNTDYWIDPPVSNSIAKRRIRSAALPVYTTRFKETSSLTPFDPIQLDALVLARSIQKFNHGSKAEYKVEVDDRYRRKTPIIRHDRNDRVYFTDPGGTEYSKDQLKQ